MGTRRQQGGSPKWWLGMGRAHIGIAVGRKGGSVDRQGADCTLRIALEHYCHPWKAGRRWKVGAFSQSASFTYNRPSQPNDRIPLARKVVEHNGTYLRGVGP